ncbi:class I SAM-dependent methyltransferase [Luteitalea sp. TBR-22]|uniref:class I SAM-dependent methyltransferase n=1 Tax=Luteitalea sp. TBR-22 TaxID=2802971 RepID=UPI001EF46DE9|nr:class I SAM-dependent methyltransferase [Luteitalea sp. TBR-22]
MPDHDCRLCGARPLVPALVIERAPRNVQRLLRAAERAADRPITLTVYQCGRCGFVQIPPVLEDTYYDDYMMVATHSPQMQAFQAAQASDFVTRFGLAGKAVVEVGCGDGNYLDHLARAGARVRGIEPSRVTRELARARGHAVEEGYVTADRVLEGGPFDAFVTRQVMEHVPDIHGVLAGIRRNLRPGAVGLIEVPSLEKALADARFYDFFSDHVNYFSFATLRLAAEMHGFEVLEVRQDMHDEYDTAIVRHVAAADLSGVQRAVNDLAGQLRAFITAQRAAGRAVAIWGAGGKGLSVLASSGISDVDLLVDSDPNKHGFYTPVSHLLVEPPSVLASRGIGAVVVTAMAYRAEVLRTLREDLGFRGVVALLGEQLEVVEG